MVSILKLLIIGIIIAAYFYIKNQVVQDSRARKVGKAGEDKIAQVLATIPDGKIFRNLYVIKPNGKSTEIDLAFLTKYKLYIIESKNYNGSILGKPSDSHWVVRYRNGKTFSFYSPVLQNNGHVNAIKSTLGLNDSIICPVIVFGSSSDISNVKGVDNCIKVDELVQFIYSQDRASFGMISPQYMLGIEQTLISMTNVSETVKTKHIQQAKRYNR